MRRRLTIIGLVLAALVGLPATAGAGAAHALVPAPEPATLALPDEIGVPWLWTPTVYQSPAQRTALIFSGSSLSMETYAEETNIVTAGGDDDVYRLLPLGEPADAVLSPDGTKVAHSAFFEGEDLGVRIFDLRINRTVVLPHPDVLVDHIEVLAWSPDGSQVAVASDGRDQAEVGVMDVATGRYRRLAIVGYHTGSPHGAAFTPDGTRLTFQDEQTVTTVRLDGIRESSFTVAADTYLAGKGAWHPDGKALALSVRTATGGRLRLVDPATGYPVPNQDFPVVADVTTIRLLGWQPGGIPLVLAFLAEGDAPVQLEKHELMDDEHLDSIEVVRLAGGAGRAETVLAAPGRVSWLDIADQVITAGAVREADGAPLWPARPRWAVFGAFLAGALILIVTRAALRR